MVDAASAGGSRDQTLLEAAKVVVALYGRDSIALANLRAAIAREEARPADGWSAMHDRAQQAEANEQWLRNECNRLDRLVAAERQRAEKAEAEAARWKARADEAETAVASHCGALPKFEGAPKACAFPHGAFSNAGPSHDLKPFNLSDFGGEEVTKRATLNLASACLDLLNKALAKIVAEAKS